jgi:uncharacterized protein
MDGSTTRGGEAAEPPFTDVLTSVEELRERYRNPVQAVAEKKLPAVVPWARAVIEAAPFVFLATADATGRPTVSPKGGAPGFVTVLDEGRLAIPDYPGNNLIDGLRNVVANPRIGLIFVIPGRSETLRVDGRAWVTTEPAVLDACARERGRPKTAIGVAVDDVFIHCPSSFQRAGLWDTATWRPDAGDSFVAFIRAVLPPEELPDWAQEGADDDDADTDEVADDDAMAADGA